MAVSTWHRLVGRREVSWTQWRPTVTPALAAVTYVAFGMVALVISDVVVPAVVTEPLQRQVQMLKGGVEVVATGTLIYWLTATSRRQLQATNRSLTRQREELGVLHRVLRHNLRNALTVIHGRVEHVHRVGDDPDVVRRNCDRISDAVEDVSSLIDTATRIRRIAAEDGETVEVDLMALVERVVDETDGPVTVHGPDRPVRATVDAQFELAVAELLDNAFEHAEPDPDVHLEVDPAIGEVGQVGLRVWDDGPGFPDAVHSVFSHRDFDQLAHMEGIGLWFVYWTVADVGGTVSLASTEGARVTCTLPRAGAGGWTSAIAARLRRAADRNI